MNLLNKEPLPNYNNIAKLTLKVLKYFFQRIENNNFVSPKSKKFIMKSLSFLSLLLLLTISTSGFSQEVVNPKTPDTLSPWTKKNQLGFDISEIAFVNWSAGGTSSVSGLVKGDFSRIYAKKNSY